jgi:hypothetical protein
MANRKAHVSQADLERAIKGFQNAGLELGALRIETDGTIVLIAKGHEGSFAELDWRDGTIFERSE